MKLKVKHIENGIYELKEDFAYKNIIVPRGTKTDFASTPKWIHWLYPPQGKYSKASIIHDYMYNNKTDTRLICDAVFYDAMKDSKVNFFTRWIFFISVRIFGGRYYGKK